jgi:septum formation inhibitor MinC
MLQGKQINGSSLKWKVPIVLDVSSFSPDGSPHFSQVISNQPNLLEEFVSILNGFGINVMGVVGVSGGGMETEAVQLGLPSIMARSSASHRGRTPEGGSMDIHDVIDMVITKQMQDPTSNAPITANAPEMNVKSEMEEEIELVHKDNKIELVEKEKETEQDIELVEKKSESSSWDLPDVPTLPSPPRFATVYHGNVRSGQLVASERNQSVIIIGSVNSGGEVLSDGDVFIFGRLKGRAMAGLGAGGAQSKIEPIDGDDEGNSHSKKEITLSARIFASHFDPELICIGDAFTTVDNVTDFGLNKAGEAAMVSLDEEGQLAFERIPL